MSIHYHVVSNWFIEKSKQENIEITPRRLQKLVYLAHAWSLGVTRKPLISEKFEAWKYGPVLRKLYKFYRSVGNNPIQKSHRKYKTDIIDNDSHLKSLLEFIWLRYSQLDTEELFAMTSNDSGPWAVTLRNYSETQSEYIPNILLEEYYHKLYRIIY